MAQYNITTEINEALADGFTLDQIREQSGVNVDTLYDDYIVWNRREVNRFTHWHENRTANAAPDAATGPQINYLSKLISTRHDDAFFMTIPADLTTLTKAEASTLIDALKRY